MKTSFFTLLEPLPYFTIEAMKQLLGDETKAAGTIRTSLYRWMKAGRVIQLKKGVYMTRRFYELHRADEDFSGLVSAILIPQSYLSLEYVLQRNSILTDVTYPISSITTKQTRSYSNEVGNFTYSHIKETLYSGYVIHTYMGISISKATLAKALFDTLYLRPWYVKGQPLNFNLAEELRLNLEDFSKTDQAEFASFVTLSKSIKMDRILYNLRNTVWRP